MRVMGVWALLGALGTSAACSGDHYEGGGRRDTVPTTQESNPGPNVGIGAGTSTEGGTSGTAGSAAVEPQGGESGEGPFGVGAAAGSVGL